MIWKSHALVNAGTVLIVTNSPKLALVAAATAGLPDYMERFITWGMHRTWTHIVTGWAALWIYAKFHFDPYVQTVILSCLLHVLADSLSLAGVPLLFPGLGKLRFGLYRTGAFSELAMTGVLTVVMAITYFSLHPFYRMPHLPSMGYLTSS